MSGEFDSVAPEVPERREVVDQLHMRWSTLGGRFDEAKEGAVIAWTPRVSWPLPLCWPPRSDWQMAQYGYAYLPDLPGLREAERIAGPWARITYDAASVDVTWLGDDLEVVGRQPFRTLEPAHTGLYVEAHDVHRALHRAMRTSWLARSLPWYRLDERIRPLYRLWVEHNKRLIDCVRADHTEFIRFLRDG